MVQLVVTPCTKHAAKQALVKELQGQDVKLGGQLRSSYLVNVVQVLLPGGKRTQTQAQAAVLLRGGPVQRLPPACMCACAVYQGRSMQ